MKMAQNGEDYERQLRHNTYHRDHTENSSRLPKQNTTRPFFHPHPYHKVVVVGMGCAIGYSAFLSALLVKMKRPAGVAVGDNIYLPLHFNFRGQPGTFVNPRWGTFVYTASLAYALAIYLVGDRKQYLPLEASLVYGAAACVLTVCHHQAASIVFDGVSYGRLLEMEAKGIDSGYGLDTGLLLVSAAIFALTTANVFMRANAAKKERREAGGALDAL